MLRAISLTAVLALPVLGAAGCGDDPPPWCASEGQLDIDCTGPACAAVIVVDYKRLEPRGYRVLKLGSGQPVDWKGAEALAVDHITKQLGQPPPDARDTEQAGDLFHMSLRYDTNDNWLVIVHGPTSTVLFAGFEDWAALDRNHDFPLPKGYHDARALGCVDDTPAPRAKALVTTGFPMGSAIASTARQAWDVARRLNLTRTFAGTKPYEALVIGYAPANGEFDPKGADWYIWLTHAP